MSTRYPRPFQGRAQSPALTLPPYPEHYAATSIASQVEYQASTWQKASRSLRAEIAAAEKAIVAQLAAQRERDAARQEISSLAKKGVRR
jgi:hypothetical protein